MRRYMRAGRGVNVGAMLVASILSGCAGAANEPAITGPRTAAVGCHPEEFPETLPTPDMLVDTAALGADIAALAAAHQGMAGFVVLSMGYQRDGINLRRAVIEHSLSPSQADSIQKLVFAHRETLPESQRERGARLRIDIDGGIAYGVDRREYCAPRPRDPDIESAMRSFIGAGVRYRGGRREQVVLLRALIHPSGYVESVTVVRGGISGSTLERELLFYMQQFSFSPATLDGFPTHGHVEVPVRILG
jgi:hypothetical protein